MRSIVLAILGIKRWCLLVFLGVQLQIIEKRFDFL